MVESENCSHQDMARPAAQGLVHGSLCGAVKWHRPQAVQPKTPINCERSQAHHAIITASGDITYTTSCSTHDQHSGKHADLVPNNLPKPAAFQCNANFANSAAAVAADGTAAAGSLLSAVPRYDNVVAAAAAVKSPALAAVWKHTSTSAIRTLALGMTKPSTLPE